MSKEVWGHNDTTTAWVRVRVRADWIHGRQDRTGQDSGDLSERVCE